jgi:hypothetical protein
MLDVWEAIRRLSGIPWVLLGPFSGRNAHHGIQETIRHDLLATVLRSLILDRSARHELLVLGAAGGGADARDVHGPAVSTRYYRQPGAGRSESGSVHLELGVAPGYTFSKASVAVPVKVGLSLSNYYELSGTDHKFGFFSVAGIVTVPLGSPSKFGSWNIHNGAEFQKLGDTTTFFNGGDDSQVIGSIGIGFSY